jgi:hypothetical protein
LGKANCELGEIRNDVKIARQKLQKAAAVLKSIGNYRHNDKLTHVLLALFIVFAGMVGLMLYLLLYLLYSASDILVL